MTLIALRKMVLGLFLTGMAMPLSGQGQLSVSLGAGGKYLLPEQPLRQQDLRRNANSGVPVQIMVEYQLDHFWAAAFVSGGRERWEAGTGSPLWPGRNKPIHHQAGWWSGSGGLMAGQRFSLGFLDQLNLTPYIGVGYDWHQDVHYCGTGATISEDFRIPITQASVNTAVSSGIMAGGGIHLDCRLVDDAHPIWLRFGASGWWRQFPLLEGDFHLWRDGGRMAQQPPWGNTPPRPGQKFKMSACEEAFSVSPDESHAISLPGHSLNWTVGLRFDL